MALGIARWVWIDAAVAVEDVGIEIEPVAIERAGTGLDDVLEGEESPSGMVEDAIEDDPDPTLVGCVEERPQRIVTAEERIDREIVRRVVAMVRCGREHRVQVQPVDPEVDEIVEPVDDAVE